MWVANHACIGGILKLLLGVCVAEGSYEVVCGSLLNPFPHGFRL